VSRGRNVRVVVYGLLLLAAAGGLGAYQWLSIPNQVERRVRELAHPNARVAAQAWHELNQLYYTRWAAVEPILAHAADETPVYFQILPQPAPDAALRRSYAPTGHAWFYRAPDGVESRAVRSVGDALCALLYNARKDTGDPVWKHDYRGDWRSWWVANYGYYGADTPTPSQTARAGLD